MNTARCPVKRYLIRLRHDTDKQHSKVRFGSEDPLGVAKCIASIIGITGVIGCFTVNLIYLILTHIYAIQSVEATHLTHFLQATWSSGLTPHLSQANHCQVLYIVQPLSDWPSPQLYPAIHSPHAKPSELPLLNDLRQHIMLPIFKRPHLLRGISFRGCEYYSNVH